MHQRIMLSFFTSLNEIKFNLSLSYSFRKKKKSTRQASKLSRNITKEPEKASLRTIISQGTQSLTRSLQRCKFARRSIAHLRSYLEKEVPFASDACCAHTMSGGLVARPRTHMHNNFASGDSSSPVPPPRRMHPRMLQCYRAIVISLRLLRCFNTFVLYSRGRFENITIFSTIN